jgi:hypothetical protein
MDTPTRIQHLLRASAMMTDVLKDEHALTDMEMQLLCAHLRQVIAELEMNQLRGRRVQIRHQFN